MAQVSKHNCKAEKTQENPTVLFRCDGSAALGMGHVMRCLALAQVLRDCYGGKAVFALREGPLAAARLKRHGFGVLESGEEGASRFDYALWLTEAVRRLSAGAVVLDVRDELPGRVLAELRDAGTVVATLDDPSDRRRLADLAFYPPVPQVARMSWEGFTGELLVGWDWVVLRPGFGGPACPSARQTPRLLVSMGGSDPAGLTFLALRALEQVKLPFEATLVLGPGFQQREPLDRLLGSASRSLQVLSDVQDMASVMRSADLALVSFGVTAYELAASGIPALYLCLDEEAAQAASVFEENGLGISLGVYTDVETGSLVEGLEQLLSNPLRRRQMGTRAFQCVDGQGVFRVAGKIVSRMRTLACPH